MAGQSVGAVIIDAILNNKIFNKQVSGTVKGAEKSFSSAFGKIGKTIGAALSVAAVGAFAKSCVQAAATAESAFMGLNSILTAQNKSFSQANDFIKEYTEDGLVGMSAAVTSYKNLAARGYSTEQIEKVMLALKDSAAFGRAAAYSYEDAIASATEGLRQENSILVDNAGVTKNVAKMWDEYAASIGKTANNLTQQEKIQAEVNGILAETKFQMGDAARYADTFQGHLSKLTGTFSKIKTEIGNIIIPIADLFIPYIQAAADAVLRFVTRIKQLLALFGLKMKEIGGDSAGAIASGMDAAANSAGAAADAIGSTGDAATAAAKAVKRALAPYDELNKLTFANSSSSGGGGGGVGGSGDDVSIPDVSTATESTESAIEQMATSGAKWLALLKKGFDDAFGDTNFDGIKGHIKGIGDTIKDVFGDPAVQNAAQGVVDSFLYAFGSMAGAVARIGTNIVEGFVGAIDYGLETIKEDLKDRFVRLFDGISLSLDLSASIWQLLGEISDIFASDEAKRLGGELLDCFLIPAGMLVQFAIDTTNGILQSIEQALRDNKGAIKVALTDLLEFGGDIVQPIREAFQGIADAYDDAYEKYLAPAFDGFAQGWSDFIGGFLDVWNEKGKPVLDEIGRIWDEFVTGDLGPAFEKLIEAGSKIIGFFGELWETIGGPTGKAAGDGAVTVVTIIKDALNILLDVLGLVADLAGSAFEVLGGGIETVTGILKGINTGDWSGVADGLLSIARGLGNIIDAVLEFLGVDFDLTDWVEQAFAGAGDFIEGLKNGIVEGIKGIGEWLKTNLFDPIVNGFKRLFGINSPSTVFADLGGNIIDGLKNGLANGKKKTTDAWANVKGWFSDIKKTASISISQKWSSISGAWNNLTKNIKDKTANMKAKVATKWGDLSGKWSNITKNIKDKTASMKAKIGTAWSDLRGKWNSLINNFKDKTVTVTLKIKSIISDMKSWVNDNVIKKINKYVPFVKIPYLASGGWLPANAPQLAVVGDNKREGEIVAPESKIREQVKQAISEMGGGMMGTIRLEIAMPDGRVLIKEINRAQMAAGRVLLNV